MCRSTGEPITIGAIGRSGRHQGSRDDVVPGIAARCGSDRGQAWHPSAATRIVAFLPLCLLIYSWFAAPVYFEPMFPNYPTILGIRLGFIVDAIAMLWMALGVALLWNAKAVHTEALVFVLFTLPASVIVLMAPPIALILVN